MKILKISSEGYFYVIPRASVPLFEKLDGEVANSTEYSTFDAAFEHCKIDSPDGLAVVE